MTGKTCRYFAFGSNLRRSRLEARVGAVGVVGVASLSGFRFSVDKPGLDQSAKANVIAASDAVVWGVVFALPQSQLAVLDRHEGGYERIEVAVTTADRRCACWTYVASGRTDDLPFDWYKEHMVVGARDHGLPASWQAMLRALPCKSSSRW